MLTCYRHQMVARDTSLEAAALQVAIHRQFEPAERFRLAIEMSEFARSLTRAGLRMRHPEYTEARLDDEMIKHLYGISVHRK